MRFGRGFKLALVASLCLATTAPALGETWRGIEIDTGGWIPVAKDDDSYVLVKMRQQQAENRQVWARFEVSQPKTYASFSTRSALALIEFDCANGRSRTLQELSYSDNNLKGDERDGDATDWSYVVAGSNEDNMFKLACNSP